MPTIKYNTNKLLKALLNLLLSDETKMTTETPKDGFLDIMGLVSIFLNQKVLIISIVLLVSSTTAIYSLLVEEEWISYTTVVPGENPDIKSSSGGLSGLASSLGVVNVTSEVSDIDKNIAILESRYFLNKFIRDNDLTKVLFSERWNSADNKWITSEPSESEIYDLFFGELLSVNKDRRTGVITIGIRYKDPFFARDTVNNLLEEVNAYIRADIINKSKRNIEFINKNLEEAAQKETRNSLSSLLRSELNELMVAETLDDLAFRVIDPAFIPKQRAYPSRTRMVLLAAFISFFGSLFIAFFRERNIHS